MTQTLVRPHMRALASAILLFIINLIGLGLGPFFVGVLSDALKPSFGVDSVRYALLGTVTVGAVWTTATSPTFSLLIRRGRGSEPPTPRLRCTTLLRLRTTTRPGLR